MDTNKLKTALKYWYEGLGYHDVIRAMHMAERIHTGTRKDNITPEIHHQISVSGYLKTLYSGLLHPKEVYICAWLHDAPEDYLEKYEALISVQSWMTHEVFREISLLNKTSKTTASYYWMLSESSIASVVKGADRIHNHQTMDGVFTAEKKEAYIEETENYVIPMLKEARMNFSEQSNIYYNIIHVLRSQIELIGVK